MKAFTLIHNGGIENLILDNLPIPDITQDEVLIRTVAISINPVDIAVRKNPLALERLLKPEPGEKIILGWDIAGEVIETGSEVEGIKAGDHVFGLVNFPGHAKGYAEYVKAPAKHLTLKPTNISFESAAAASLAAITAWQALSTYGKIKNGEKVLIHASSGGVGHFAVQIAKAFGAYVIGTGSAANRDFILKLGADEFIDYQTQTFEEHVKDADLILDPLPGDNLTRSLSAIKNGGRIISLVTPFDGEVEKIAKGKNVTGYRMSVVSNGEDMQQIAVLLSTGKVIPHIFESYEFDRLPQAHLALEGNTRGKIVIRL
jgi:NADPH:quinone reductase-like Zn-dependent oxidoreductase